MNGTPKLSSLLDQFFLERKGVVLLGLSTVDGFDVYTQTHLKECPSDKIAALTSTMCAMGSAISEQILSEELNSIIVESSGTNVIYTKNKYRGSDTILAIAYSEKIALGEARFLTKRLASSITELDEP